MVKILLLEDEQVLREELSEYLADSGYQVTPVASVTEFWRMFSENQNILILDLGLPDGEGIELISRLRNEGHKVGIIVFTARDNAESRLNGLGIGADYYLSKTCDLKELQITVQTLVRRLDIAIEAGWLLHKKSRQVSPPGFSPIALSAQDYTVLSTIISGGDCATRKAICQALGVDYLTYDQRRLDTQIHRLRRKVEQACGLTLPIITIRGSGFRFYAPVSVV
jgi:DNA-binding response OmpR family regulator